ncbi:hypothetical protein [Actinoalloteichus fjordicus]|uniref:hypothetical protein n=1 Tax=Actinoalloteichus fjordicus TaxID=1612552 RepID=UPI0012FA9181|nr:hypothetical protein [Actinoalloteichus fjordicus]
MYRSEEKRRFIIRSTPAADADPIARASGRFPLDGFTILDRHDDAASPAGVRPWGLRRARPVGQGLELPAHGSTPHGSCRWMPTDAP